MEWNNEIIKHTLKTWGFNLNELDINKIKYVPMHEWGISSKDKPQLYIDNLQCCVGLFAYGNNFGFISHINPIVIRNNEYIIGENGELTCSRCNDLLNQILNHSKNITEPFQIGIALGIMPLNDIDMPMVSLYKGINKVISILRELDIPVNDYIIIDAPELIIDTRNNTIITSNKTIREELPYTKEIIVSPDGIRCHVLDTNKIEFDSNCIGRKNKETIVLRANGNERIDTINSLGLIESTYITKPGEAIFYNSENDQYVPRDGNGNSRMFDDIENYDFEITTPLFQFKNNEAVKVKNKKVAYLLPKIINKPTCIKDAWGLGNHQFLYEGATLKKDPDTNKVTGIEKEAFDNTWEIFTNKEKNR